MNKFSIAQRVFLIVFILLSGCGGGNPDIQVNELSSNTTAYDETIHINNCGGKADSEQTASRSFATNIEGGIDVGVQQVVEGVISAKYSQYRNVSKSQKLVAPAGTNMEFVLRWSEEVRAGNVTANGSTGTYTANIPIAVEQVSSQDLGCGTPQTQEPTNTNPPNSSGFTQSEINGVLGIGNWKCFPNGRLDGVSFTSVPNNYIVTYPISNVDKQGIKYKTGEVVPSGGLATAWLEGQLASKNECP